LHGSGGGLAKEREFSVYVIVRCGGRQEKVSVDDVLTVDKLDGDVGSSVTLPAVLVVDDANVVSDPAEVGRYEVTAEIVGAERGPKINMVLYKNKTGYRRRIGHRQKYTQVRITSISDGKGGGAKSTAKASTSKASTSKAGSSKATASKASTSKASAGRTSASKASATKTSASKTSAGRSTATKASAGKAAASARKKA
jgi:large subunit ribosomal protein L21